MAHVPLDRHPEAEVILEEDMQHFTDEGARCPSLQRKAEQVAALFTYFRRYKSNFNQFYSNC